MTETKPETDLKLYIALCETFEAAITKEQRAVILRHAKKACASAEWHRRTAIDHLCSVTGLPHRIAEDFIEYVFEAGPDA